MIELAETGVHPQLLKCNPTSTRVAGQDPLTRHLQSKVGFAWL